MTVKHSVVATGADDPTKEINKGEWNADHVADVSSADRVLFVDAGGVITDSANFKYTETSGPRLQIGVGNGTSTGIFAGYLGSAGFGAIWSTSVTPSGTNYMLVGDSASTYLGCPLSGGTVYIAPNNTPKVAVIGTAGAGPSITAGTATTDVQALSATQTWNAVGVAFTGWKYTITDTASAAGSLALQILGGSAGTTNLLSLGNAGDISIPGFVSVAEMTAPAGAANTARIFAQDNGSGKTQLMVIFGSGAAQQLAIEV